MMIFAAGTASLMAWQASIRRAWASGCRAAPRRARCSRPARCLRRRHRPRRRPRGRARRQQHRQAAAEQLLVVDDEDADRLRLASWLTYTTRVMARPGVSEAGRESAQLTRRWPEGTRGPARSRRSRSRAGGRRRAAGPCPCRRQVEVVADQLHLVERLVQRHRVGGCVFSRTTSGPSPVTVIGPTWARSPRSRPAAVSRSARRPAGSATRVAPLRCTRRRSPPAHLRGHLVQGEVQSAHLVDGRGLGPITGPLENAVARAYGPVGLTGVTLRSTSTWTRMIRGRASRAG